MSEPVNTPSTAAPAPMSCGCTANPGSNAPKQPPVQAAAACATPTPPPAQKGFKRQGRKQQPPQH